MEYGLSWGLNDAIRNREGLIKSPWNHERDVSLLPMDQPVLPFPKLNSGATHLHHHEPAPLDLWWLSPTSTSSCRVELLIPSDPSCLYRPRCSRGLPSPPAPTQLITSF